MPSELPSFIRLHQGLNAIATTFLRHAFAGAILAERHFRRSPRTISGAACGSKRHAKSCVECARRAPKRPYRYLHGATKPGATVATLPRS